MVKYIEEIDYITKLYNDNLNNIYNELKNNCISSYKNRNFETGDTIFEKLKILNSKIEELNLFNNKILEFLNDTSKYKIKPTEELIKNNLKEIINELGSEPTIEMIIEQLFLKISKNLKENDFIIKNGKPTWILTAEDIILSMAANKEFTLLDEENYYYE